MVVGRVFGTERQDLEVALDQDAVLQVVEVGYAVVGDDDGACLMLVVVVVEDLVLGEILIERGVVIHGKMRFLDHNDGCVGEDARDKLNGVAMLEGCFAIVKPADTG